ncbi:enoyl-CoA hydratase-related protein [Nocardioides sp. SOB44]|uniref:Enoyl-CoA hydratase-related protein n=1 Tax=Nocardioides cremeus TaxID=3058044 RepID=A0ABT8TJF6_9ACTN|nr:enoyl-CoA hydratase-related protein [Nocardioides cremeus]MDO3394099.1 enoyl-CoA hydratase-related protein [Nocardioides cremeus]
MPTLSQDGALWTLHLGDDENRFTPAFLDETDGFLADLASSSEPAALVTTGGGKFYSNGLDLEWLGAHPERLGEYVARVQQLFERVLTLPVPTVAAVNGHAFGAGAMLALAHDHRVMRDDRGYVCLPEVDIHIPFSPGMNALVMSTLRPRAAVDSMTTGHRFPADEALAAGIVDATASLEDLPQAAAARVEHLAGKDRTTLGTIKQRMYADVVAALRLPEV